MIEPEEELWEEESPLFGPSPFAAALLLPPIKFLMVAAESFLFWQALAWNYWAGIISAFCSRPRQEAE